MNIEIIKKIERIIELQKNRNKVQEQIDSLNNLIKTESAVVLNDIEYSKSTPVLFKHKNKYYIIDTYDKKEIDNLTNKETLITRLKIEEIKILK
ncbi:MAG: hypothetical protein ACOC33_00020 [bacterium]